AIERVLRVEEATGTAYVAHRFAQLVRRTRGYDVVEERLEVGEHPAEVVRVELAIHDGVRRAGTRTDDRRGADAEADAFEERSAARARRSRDRGPCVARPR